MARTIKRLGERLGIAVFISLGLAASAEAQVANGGANYNSTVAIGNSAQIIHY